MMRASAALSEAKRGLVAARRVAEEVRRGLDDEVHAALVWITPPHAGRARSICEALSRAWGTPHVVGCVSPSVVVGDHEVVEGPAVAALGLRAADGAPRPEARLIEGLSEAPGEAARALVAGSGPEDLIVAMPAADAFKAEPFFAALEGSRCGQLVGGGASNPWGPDLVFAGSRTSDDAVAGLWVPGGCPEIGITQSCGVVSRVHQVTRMRGRELWELDGEQAVGCLLEAVLRMGLANAAEGMMVGLMGPRADTSSREFRVRPLLSFDADLGTVDLGEAVDEGERLVFLRRDPESARADLNAMLLELRRRLVARRPAFAVWTSCTDRGAGFYGIPHHDSSIIHGYLPEVPLAGFASGFELAPLGGRLGLNLFSGVLAAAGWSGDRS